MIVVVFITIRREFEPILQSLTDSISRTAASAGVTALFHHPLPISERLLHHLDLLWPGGPTAVVDLEQGVLVDAEEHLLSDASVQIVITSDISSRTSSSSSRRLSIRQSATPT
jgi:hypothetical protein